MRLARMASNDLASPHASDSQHTAQPEYGQPGSACPSQAPPETPTGNGDEGAAGAQQSLFSEPEPDLPGSAGEHALQRTYGSSQRAERFYHDQMLDHLNEDMIEFVGRMDMAFIATADAQGEADCSFRAGAPGFIQVLDSKRIAYPEYRGNGVMASLGNISENPHIGIMLMDFVRAQIGLHLNGRARIVEDAELRAEFDGIPEAFVRGRTPERWVVVEVTEAYIHCRKHIPRMKPVERHRAWGTDDTKRKGGDYFRVREQRRAEQQATTPPTQGPDHARANGS